MGLKCVIFDLDGVLVDTSVFHAKAWADLVRGEGYEPPEDLEDQVKGISRMESLKIALGENASKYSEEELTELADRKNACYLEAVKTVQASDLYPGARALLDGLRDAGIKVALGSASKNARAVLDGLGITDDFDVISDGTTHTRGKPHPDVFLGAAWMAGATPAESIVVEDAPAGITAALQGGFVAVGLGPKDFLSEAHVVVESLTSLDVERLQALHTEYRIPSFKGPAALPELSVRHTQDFALQEKGASGVWDALPWSSLECLAEKSGASYTTRMKMQYSDTALYVLVEAQADERSDQPDELVISVMPDPWQRFFLSYKVSTAGDVVAMFVSNHMGTTEQHVLDASSIEKSILSGGCGQDDASPSGWTIEVKIPVATFAAIVPVPPRTGTVWYGNVCRAFVANGHQSQQVWSPPSNGRFDDYTRFGMLRFS